MILELQSTSTTVNLDTVDEKTILLLHDNALKIIGSTFGLSDMDAEDIALLQQDAEYIKETIETYYAQHLI